LFEKCVIIVKLSFYVYEKIPSKKMYMKKMMYSIKIQNICVMWLI